MYPKLDDIQQHMRVVRILDKFIFSCAGPNKEKQNRSTDSISFIVDKP